MANIAITEVCNRACSYCFARDAFKGHSSGVKHMPIEQFERSLDFLERSGINQARILGGEPTLHPEFTDLIGLALDRGLRLIIFSNGLMSEKALRRLEDIPADLLSVVINTNIPEDSTVAMQARQNEVFSRLGPRVLPGLNLYSPSIKPDFILKLINKFSLSRTIRLGLAHPCVSKDNVFLHSRYYETVGQNIVSFMKQAKKEGVSIEFDCGFVPCMFSKYAYGEIEESASDIGQRCNPILDLLPDGTVIPCYPFSSFFRVQLSDYKDADELRDWFYMRMKPYRLTGIFKECSSCHMRKERRCAGGCLAASMQRLRFLPFAITNQIPQKRKTPFSFELNDGRTSSTTIYKCEKSSSTLRKKQLIIPYIDQPMQFWEDIDSRFSGHIKEVYFPLPGNIVGSGRPRQPDKHIYEFLHRSPFALSALVNLIVLPRPVEDIATEIIESLKKLTGDYGLAGVTVSNLTLAFLIKENLPELSITASVLMDISQPNQALLVNGICDILVPASRIVRDLPALKALKAAFKGHIRLMVNEGCLSGCPLRIQHFYEMGYRFDNPHSLCDEFLSKNEWMRLTGAWVLPQHLKFYSEIYDELKLAGRVTLQHPADYMRVLDGYIGHKSLLPNEIGGGPASMIRTIEIQDDYYLKTLICGHRCHECTLCKDYYQLRMCEYVQVDAG